MKVFGAVGFGIFLIILSVMMPHVFAELSKTFIVFLQSTQQILEAVTHVAAAVATIKP